MPAASSQARPASGNPGDRGRDPIRRLLPGFEPPTWDSRTLPGEYPVRRGKATFKSAVKSSVLYPYRSPAAPDLTDNNWTNLFPRLDSVSALSNTDAWAVGEYGHLLHYTGGSWTDIDPPNLRGYKFYDLKM